MSRAYEYTYSIERARRQAIYNERVSATTEHYYNQYVSRYEQMLAQGLDAYIPDEISRLKSDLSQIRDLLTTDPTEARDISFDVGSYINGLWTLAQTARNQFDRIQKKHAEEIRHRKAEKQNKLLNEYFDIISRITNPMVINYAQKELDRIKSEIQENTTKITSENIKVIIAEVIELAEQKAKDWKEKTLLEQKTEATLQRIEAIEGKVTEEKLQSNEKTQEFIEKIKILKNNIKIGSANDAETNAAICTIEKDIDDEKISETIRKEAVVAIVKELKEQEFSVEHPTLEKNGDENFVKIIAHKPSGKRAMCKIDLQGKIAYKFDNYEGMTCLKDIERFNIDLKNIYSISLSDERVIWSNPNRLSKDAQNMPEGNRGVKNG